MSTCYGQHLGLWMHQLHDGVGGCRSKTLVLYTCSKSVIIAGILHSVCHRSVTTVARLH